jgi:hypothetical protein
MASSSLFKNEFIINDDPSSDKFWKERDERTGLLLEMRGNTDDYAYGDYATPFPEDLLVPESDWEEIIKEQEKLKSRTSDFVTRHKIPYKDQGRTNYCWIYAPTHACEITAVKQGQPYIELAPESVGARIKNFANVGGWGLEGLKKIIEWGIVPRSMWPAWELQRKYDTTASRTEALKYRVNEWYECRPRTINQMVSLILRGLVGAAGLNWWGHEVTYCDVLWLDGKVAIRARNSWLNYGDNGFFTLQGSKMLADDLVFPATMIPYSLASSTKAAALTVA